MVQCLPVTKERQPWGTGVRLFRENVLVHNSVLLSEPCSSSSQVSWIWDGVMVSQTMFCDLA